MDGSVSPDATIALGSFVVTASGLPANASLSLTMTAGEAQESHTLAADAGGAISAMTAAGAAIAPLLTGSASWSDDGDRWTAEFGSLSIVIIR